MVLVVLVAVFRCCTAKGRAQRFCPTMPDCYGSLRLIRALAFRPFLGNVPSGRGYEGRPRCAPRRTEPPAAHRALLDRRAAGTGYPCAPRRAWRTRTIRAARSAGSSSPAPAPRYFRSATTVRARLTRAPGYRGPPCQSRKSKPQSASAWPPTDPAPRRACRKSAGHRVSARQVATAKFRTDECARTRFASSTSTPSPASR